VGLIARLRGRKPRTRLEARVETPVQTRLERLIRTSLDALPEDARTAESPDAIEAVHLTAQFHAGPGWVQLTASVPPNAIELPGGRFVAVIGESHDRSDTGDVCRGCLPGGVHFETRAVLRPESTNPNDPRAVRVEIHETVVGYLSRPSALAFRRVAAALISREAVGVVDARIAGGADDGSGTWGGFGVAMDLADPDELLYALR
jgi:hypothetical protein